MSNETRPTWDVNQYRELYQTCKANQERSRHKNRPPFVMVWQNTLDILKAGGYTCSNGKVVELLPDSQKMLDKSKVYSKEIHLPDDIPSLDKGTVTWVENNDCLFLGKELQDFGLNPLVLNFSNQQKACGDIDLGPTKGQEQDILRRTNLIMSQAQYYDEVGKPGKWSTLVGVNLKYNAYPLNQKYGCLYSPDVTVFRAWGSFGFDLLEEPFRISIISCGTMKRESKEEEPDNEFDCITKEQMRTIFRVGLVNGHDALVLGAWGCGSYHIPPKVMAELFHEVSQEEEFKNKYRAIVFACGEAPKKNYLRGKNAPFYKTFGFKPEKLEL